MVLSPMELSCCLFCPGFGTIPSEDCWSVSGVDVSGEVFSRVACRVGCIGAFQTFQQPARIGLEAAERWAAGERVPTKGGDVYFVSVGRVESKVDCFEDVLLVIQYGEYSSVDH
jgi:hypothetical protein